jgi:hypothetical protein
LENDGWVQYDPSSSDGDDGNADDANSASSGEQVM